MRTTALGVDAGVAHPGDVVELEPVEALHHEHAAGHELGVRAGHDVAGLAEVVEHRRDVEHVGGLDAEVELLDDGVGEQLDERRGVGQGGDRDAPDEVRGEPGHRPQVDVHEAGDVGALDLDDDVLARDQAGGVHLGDRGGGDRLGGERLEDLAERPSEVGLDGPADVVERLGGHLVAAALELLDQLAGEDALAGGDDLPELDERRTERLDGQTQPSRTARLTPSGPRTRPAAAPPQPRHDRRPEPGDDRHPTAAGRQPARR